LWAKKGVTASVSEVCSGNAESLSDIPDLSVGSGFGLMTSSKNPFASPRSRWKRGKEHTAKLKNRSDSSFKTAPGDTVREKELDGSEILKFKLEKPLPEICTHYAAEALEALRSALDQTDYAAAVASGVAKPKSAKFPFGNTAADMNRCPRCLMRL
jgi:hypothetical protein